MARMAFTKMALLLVLAGMVMGCSSSGGSTYTRTSKNTPDFEPALNTATGLATKKEKIEKLRDELMNIRLQIEERNRLLDELGNIKKAIGSDTLIDNTSGF